ESNDDMQGVLWRSAFEDILQFGCCLELGWKLRLAHFFLRFGDLRPPNILVTKDCQKVMLIDFDWSGKLGVARYPAGGVNPEYAWPDGVEANGRIEREHDLGWFKTLNS
ncbi:13803_t:CDS:1, partial [Acaulospora colombiana]